MGGSSEQQAGRERERNRKKDENYCTKIDIQVSAEISLSLQAFHPAYAQGISKYHEKKI